MTQQPSFLARRRAGLKAEREAALAAIADVQDEVADNSPEVPDLHAMSDADILDLLDLPDPDALRKGDNFAAFMAKAVPLHLRNRALRTLWRSDPVLACLDGLNDYDADYLTGSTGQGVIQTSYQVGKGLLAHVEKLAAEAAANDAAILAEDPLDAGSDTPAAAAIDDAVVLAAGPVTDDTVPTDAVDRIAFDAGNYTDDATDEGVALTATAPRRMRFAFGERA